MKPSELKQVLRHAFLKRFPLLIVGSPGVGKSDIVKSVADSLGIELFISHPVVKDPTDYKGLGAIVNGQAEFLPFGDLRVMLEATRPTLVFLDDLGQCSNAVAAALMQLILERSIDGKKISDEVVFVAATNRASDRSGVSPIIEALKSRFMSIVNLNPDLDEWISWAYENNMPAELIAFLRFKPSYFTDPWKPTREIENSVSPRTISAVGKWQRTCPPSELELEIYSGAAGAAFGTEYIHYLKIARNLPTAEDILDNPMKIKVPNEPSELYSICGSLAYAITVSNFSQASLFINRLPEEYQIMTIKDAIGRNPLLIQAPEFDQFLEQNKELILV